MSDTPTYLGWTTLISPQDLANLFDQENVVVIDCRFDLTDPANGRSAYEIEHIPGSRYAHLDDDLSGTLIPGRTGRHPLPDPDDFIQRIGNWGINNATQVVAYDASGGAFASRLWWMFNWLGHERIAVLDGGWNAWVEGGYPTTSHIIEFESDMFSGHANSSMIVTADELLDLLHDDRFKLIDARAGARFYGEEEPLDPVAGHIPGAFSFPFKENVDDKGRFLPKGTLERRFGLLLKDTSPDHIVSYCGSGVTAAHNALAIRHAGQPMPKLYPGSWSEWITDPSRPVATQKK